MNFPYNLFSRCVNAALKSDEFFSIREDRLVASQSSHESKTRLVLL